MINELSGHAGGHVLQARQIIGDVHLVSPVASTATVPRQLPARRLFVDRTGERTVLKRLTLDIHQKPVAVVITGPGGVGKSALAVETAHAIANEFPDGQIHLELGAKSSSEALGEILRGLGVHPQEIPVGEGERAALYRSRTAERRLLVVLDNALSASQVRPLIPASPSCFVVITSRAWLSELAMDGARHLPLERLETDHAVELLESTLGSPVLGDDRDAAVRIAQLCHRLPLAIAVAAATVATRPSQTLATLATTLTTRDGALGLAVGSISVRGVIAVSYEQLSDLARTIYRVMALHPTEEWSRDAAAAAVDQPAPRVDAAVDDLVEANLVSQSAAGLLRFHDLIREHALRSAEETLTTDDRERAVRGMVEYYARRCVALDRMLRPMQRKFSTAYQDTTTHFVRIDEAMAWFRRDRSVAVAAVRVATENGWTALACALAESVWALLLRDGHFHEVVATQELGATAGQTAGVPFEAVAVMRVSFGLRHLGRYDAARERCSAALDLAHLNPSSWGREDLLWIESAAAHERGTVAEVAGDLDTALVDYERAIEVEEERLAHVVDESGYGLAQRRRSAAWIHALHEDFATAHELLDVVEATMRAIMDTTDDSSGYARTQQLRGRVYCRAGDWEQARKAMLEAAMLLLACNAYRWLTDVHADLADIELAFADTESARQHLTIAYQVAIADGHSERAAALGRRLSALSANPCPNPATAARNEHGDG